MRRLPLFVDTNIIYFHSNNATQSETIKSKKLQCNSQAKYHERSEDSQVALPPFRHAEHKEINKHPLTKL